MRGTIVVARCYNNKPAVLRVWECDDRLAYLASERRFADLQSGRAKSLPIGFPRDDVFAYDDNVMGHLVTGVEGSEVPWHRMRLWTVEKA